jgi:pentatricopeptide repeat protein
MVASDERCYIDFIGDKIVPVTINNNTSNVNSKTIAEMLKKFRANRDYDAALKLLDIVSSQDTVLSPATYTHIIQFHGEMGQLGKALYVLKTMKENNVAINERHYGALIQACRNAKQWEMAFELFNRMDKQTPKVKRNTIVYNSVIAALAEAKQLTIVLQLLKQMTSENIPKDVITYTAAINSCEKAQDWKTAIDLYQEMDAVNGIKPNSITLNSVLSACASGRQWDLALQLFKDAGNKGIIRDAVSYSVVIACMGEAKKYQLAKDLFDSMDGRQVFFADNCTTAKQTVARDTGTYNAMITACERNGKWQDALRIIDILTLGGSDKLPVHADSKTYCAAISCCGNAGKWKEAMLLFNRMDEFGLTKDIPVYNAVISALQTAGQWQQAIELLEKMGYGTSDKKITDGFSNIILNEEVETAATIFSQAQTVYSQGVAQGKIKHWKTTYGRDSNKSIFGESKTMDLHGFPLSTAKAAIDYVFRQIRDDFISNGYGYKDKISEQGNSDKQSEPFDLVIITGRGNHVNSSGTRGILRTEIESYITNTITPKGFLRINTVPSNDGVIIVSKESIKEWILASF